MLTLPILFCYINYLFGYLCATVVIALFILAEIKWTHKIGLILSCILITFTSTLFIDLYRINHYQMKEKLNNFFNKKIYLEKGIEDEKYIMINDYRMEKKDLIYIKSNPIHVTKIIYLGRFYRYYRFCIKDEKKQYAISYSSGDMLILSHNCNDYNYFNWFNKIN